MDCLTYFADFYPPLPEWEQMELAGFDPCQRPYELMQCEEFPGGNLALHSDIKWGDIEETDEAPSQMDL